MDLVLNELSFSEKYPLPAGAVQAAACLKALADVLVWYRKQERRPKAAILSKNSLKEVVLTQKGEQLNALFGALDKAASSLLLNAITQKPLIKDVPPYYFYEGVEVQGFAYAYENDLYAVSYNFGCWDRNSYVLEKVTDEAQTAAEAKHLLPQSMQMADEEEEYEEDAFYDSLKNSAELWERREDIFPNLYFCGDTERQICALGIGDKRLRTAYEKLSILDKAIGDLMLTGKNIKALDYGNIGLDITGESSSTLKKYASERSFTLPDGRSGIFELHIKMSNGRRIHFLLDEPTNKCYVGHIGKHLDT